MDMSLCASSGVVGNNGVDVSEQALKHHSCATWPRGYSETKGIPIIDTEIPASTNNNIPSDVLSIHSRPLDDALLLFFPGCGQLSGLGPCNNRSGGASHKQKSR